MSTKIIKPIINEDWTVVVLGFLIIILALGGILLPVPAFGWGNLEELISKVFTTDNLGIIGLQFLFVLLGLSLTFGKLW